MPENNTPELDQYQKDKDEFEDAVDDVLAADESKTDEEINAEMDKKQADKSGEAGEATKDPIVPAAAEPVTEPVPETDVTDGQGVTPATVVKEELPDTVEAWTTYAKALEDKLTKEKQKTSSWNGRITAANTKVKELEAELATVRGQIKTTEQTTTAKLATSSDNEVLDRFRNDFPELSNVVDIMQKRIDGVSPAQAKAVEPTPTPAQAGDTTDADADDEEKEKHIAAIREVHSDLPEMVSSGVLLTWINQQPSYIRPTLETIYKSGKAEDVITMVTNFKEESGWKSQLKPAADTAAAEKLASMTEVKSQSQTPTGTVVDKDDFDQGAKDAGL
jgi:hypothetical protein